MSGLKSFTRRRSTLMAAGQEPPGYVKVTMASRLGEHYLFKRLIFRFGGFFCNKGVNGIPKRSLIINGSGADSAFWDGSVAPL